MLLVVVPGLFRIAVRCFVGCLLVRGLVFKCCGFESRFGWVWLDVLLVCWWCCYALFLWAVVLGVYGCCLSCTVRWFMVVMLVCLRCRFGLIGCYVLIVLVWFVLYVFTIYLLAGRFAA